MKKIIGIFCIGLLYATSVTAQPVITFNHLAIYVNNLQKSTEFYKNVLQLEEVPEPFKDQKHAWFKMADRITLHVIQGAEKNVKHYRSDHFCFSVPSLQPFIERLSRYKISYVSASDEPMKVTTRVDGVHQIYLQDPDGYWIEMNDARQ
ncbi:VOC family protein [Segetibacter sp. 3557_3]|uniref:VOC family protein n=1 Tax=Segetibacter sp. 3557_3 TaxID=2547429 RepID=UPI001058EC59|nr:VOC family protein [Segetibacter sp. 3557_3]TDH25148.1 VOC family protein [Segetibacter sp. 3557_3]